MDHQSSGKMYESMLISRSGRTAFGVVAVVAGMALTE
jgi:hypothetical protein